MISSKLSKILFGSILLCTHLAAATELSQAPLLTGNDVAGIVDSIKIEVTKAEFASTHATLRGRFQTAFPFTKGLRLYSQVDTSPLTISGNLNLTASHIFANATSNGSEIMIQVSASIEDIRKLARQWKRNKNLGDVFPNLSIEFPAYYQVAIEAQSDSDLTRLAEKCDKALNWPMHCSEYAGWHYSPQLTCLDDPEITTLFTNSISIADPYLFDRDANVTIRAANRDLCDQRSSSTTIISALAGPVLAHQNHKENVSANILSTIKIRTRIQWPQK